MRLRRRHQFIPQLDVLAVRITPSTYADFGGPVTVADSGSAEYDTTGATDPGSYGDSYDGNGGDGTSGDIDVDPMAPGGPFTVTLTQVSQVCVTDPYA